MLDIVTEYKDLTTDIVDMLSMGNVFFSESYYQYSLAIGCKVWYAFSELYVMPICIFRKVGIKYGLLPTEPFCLKQVSGIEDKTAFLNDLLLALKKLDISWITTGASSLFEVYPDESLRIPFGSHVIDLSLSDEMLLANMHSKHRNSIRRAERNGVVIVSGGHELIEDYTRIDRETWNRSNRSSYGNNFFTTIIDRLKENATIYISYKDDIPQSGACFFYNKSMSYYMYGASIDNPEPGAANLLQWKAILDMKSKGVERFSFVGCRINEDEDSKYHGIQRFKERFGGELIQGYMFKCILNRRKYKLFKMLYRLKNGHDSSDAIDEEIHKWPELQIKQK